MSMIHYISLHVESARAALKELLRQPIGTLLTLLMLAVAMTLPLFMLFGHPKRTKRVGQTQRVAADYGLYGHRCGKF